MKDKRERRGIIFDIQKFCLHDGPGIRTTVFFKGCNLHCQWCHNPESMSPKKELSYRSDRCVYCGECVTACPRGVHQVNSPRHEIRFELCDGCGLCVDRCVPDALKVIGREVTVEEVVQEALKDRAFYEESGGGVTLSGGECTLQADFAGELLRELKEHGIHTCIETNGLVAEEKLAGLMPWVDQVLLDYKLTDIGLHREYTGGLPGQVLANLKLLDASGACVILRCPIVPGVNDTEEHFETIARITKEYGAVRYAEVMPYHSIGRDKWRHIGREYRFGELPSVSESLAEAWRARIRHYGGRTSPL